MGCFSYLSGASNLVSLETQKQNKSSHLPKENKNKNTYLARESCWLVHAQDRAVGHRVSWGFPGALWGRVLRVPGEGLGLLSSLSALCYTRMPNRGLSNLVHTMCFWVLIDPRCEPQWVPVPSTTPPQNSCSLVCGGGAGSETAFLKLCPTTTCEKAAKYRVCFLRACSHHAAP